MQSAHRLLVEALTKLAPVSDRTIDALVAVSEPRSFAALAWLLRAGEPAEWCFLLESGLVRELYVGRGGEEHTRAFIEPGQLTGSLLDLLSARPAVTFIQALESIYGMSLTALQVKWVEYFKK